MVEESKGHTPLILSWEMSWGGLLGLSTPLVQLRHQNLPSILLRIAPEGP
jgi:hypothetical protein